VVPLPESRKALEWDDRAEGEAVQYSFILIVALVIILGFTISGVSQYAQSGEISQGMLANTDYPFEMKDYTLINNTDGDDRSVDWVSGEEGFLVSDDDVLDYVPYPYDENPFVFVDSDGEDLKYIHVIRDNSEYDPESTDIWKMYNDFIAIRRQVDDLFFWKDSWQNAAIPFTAIEDHFDNTTNASQINFRLGDMEDYMWFSVMDLDTGEGGGTYNFTSGLWSNDFYIYYGWYMFRIAAGDFWNAVSMILYDDIPYVDDTIDFLIHAFVISTIVYVVFTMAIKVADLFPFT
jgi:hypothetical protein